jgi:regulator of sigma E protease
MGPINAIQQDSPADHAGLKVGDVIQAIDGQPVGDPLTLPNRLLEKVGQEIQFEVARTTADANGAATRTFTMTPQYPASTLGPIAPGIPMSSEELGIAYDVLNRVAYVEPDSPAEQAAVQAGDVITRVEFVPAGEQQKKDEQEKLFLLDKPINLDDEHLDWPFVDTRLQRSLPDTQIKITFQRGKQEKTVQLLPVDSQHWFDPNRGFMLTAREEEFQAASWGDALMLGLRQTKEDALKIVAFLQKLVTRKLPVTGLGGPGAIAVFATSEASESTSRLLIFLTLLSANLAVVNFLPIPVLDGGHMMFLIAEGIRGKPISEKWLIGLTLAGFAFVVSLMLFVIGLDVFRFSGWAG